MKRRLVVWGAGGHGREVLELVEALNADRRRFSIDGFLDDDASRHGTVVHDQPVLGGEAWLRERAPRPLVVFGIGNPAVRWRLVRRLRPLLTAPPTLVHPTALVSRHAALAAGSVVMAFAVVSSDVVLGEHAHVNYACSVSHDCRLGPFATLAPGVRLAGNVTVGDGCDIGVGASVIPGITLGAWQIVGAGAVVTRDGAPDTTIAGVPARVIASRPSGWHEGDGAERL